MISTNHTIHQKEHAEAMRIGLTRHGIRAVIVLGDTIIDSADFYVTWSIKRPLIFEWAKKKQKHVLVMERGHLGDRMKYASCGWDGLGRRGRYPKAKDGGERFRAMHGPVMPWKDGGSYVLLIGQVSGDSSLYGLEGGFNRWAQKMTYVFMSHGHDVRYRPHPAVRQYGDRFCPDHAEMSRAEALGSDLQDAKFCVTYNSTAGVESVLSGVPLLAVDGGAMAWPMASHSPEEPIVRPDREEWCHDLAWTQWTIEEIRSGEAWAHLAPIMEGK